MKKESVSLSEIDGDTLFVLVRRSAHFSRVRHGIMRSKRDRWTAGRRRVQDVPEIDGNYCWNNLTKNLQVHDRETDFRYGKLKRGGTVLLKCIDVV